MDSLVDILKRVKYKPGSRLWMEYDAHRTCFVLKMSMLAPSPPHGNFETYTSELHIAGELLALSKYPEEMIEHSIRDLVRRFEENITNSWLRIEI